ncbi:hypothetical protein ZWY2020_021557 [Hordeum vulgare]|nr:hypothetical protein ZWY2020_021557 [Hordeum vulgare]
MAVIGGDAPDVWVDCLGLLRRRLDSKERRACSVAGGLQRAADGLRAGEELRLVQEEGAKVDLMESSKSWKECDLIGQHGFVEWHDGPTTPFLRDLLGDLRDKVWMLEEEATQLPTENDVAVLRK